MPGLRHATAGIFLIVLFAATAFAGGGGEERIEAADDLLRQARVLERRAEALYSSGEREDGIEADSLSEEVGILRETAVSDLENLLAELYAPAWSEFNSFADEGLIEGFLDEVLTLYLETVDARRSSGAAAIAEADALDQIPPFTRFVDFANTLDFSSVSLVERLLIQGFFGRFLESESDQLQRSSAAAGEDLIVEFDVYEQTEFLNENLSVLESGADGETRIEPARENLAQLFSRYRAVVDHYDFAHIIAIEQLQLPVDGTERVLSQLRLTLSRALQAAKRYNRAVEMLSIVMNLHPRYFEDAEQQIAQIRAVRSEYNDLLQQLLTELQKDPNDPDDPLDEGLALAYIAQLESLFPEITGEETDELRATVKLAVDRGYRDRILDLAHEFMENQEYLLAMERYLSLSGLNVEEPYQDSDSSFRLQREEFASLVAQYQVSPIYVSQIADLTGRVAGETSALIAEDALWSTIAQNAQATLASAFPAEPLEISASLTDGLDTDSLSDFSSAISNDNRLFELFDGLARYSRLRATIESSANQALELRERFPEFLPQSAENRDPPYLLYIEQFVAGPAEYPGEGIVGAAYRQSRRYFDDLFALTEVIAANYENVFADAYEEAQYQLVLDLAASLNAFGLVQKQLLHYQALGEAQPAAGPANLASAVQREDRPAVLAISIREESRNSRESLSRLALNYESLAGQQFALSENAFENYRIALDLRDELLIFSSAFQDLLELRREELSAFSETEGSFADDIGDALSLHLSDVDRLNGEITTLAINYFNQYLALEQENAPQRQAEAVSLVDEADSDLAGILDESGATLRYPGRAIDKYESATEEFLSVITISQRLQAEIDQAPEFISRSAAVSQPGEEYARLVANAESEIRSMQTNLSLARQRLEESLLLLRDARDFRADVEQAISRQEVDAADRLFASMDELYLSSISINADPAVVEEHRQLTESDGSLFARLEELKITIARQRRDEAIAATVQLIDEREWILANNALQDAVDQDRNLPETESDPRIPTLQEIINRGIVLANQGDLRETDSNYSRLSTFLNNAAVGLVNAREARSGGQEGAFQRYVRDVRINLDGVFAQLPANFEAKIMELELLQLRQPEQFAQELNAEIDELIGSIGQIVGTGIYDLQSLERNYQQYQQRLSSSDPSLAELLTNIRAFQEFIGANTNRDLDQAFYYLRLVAGEINPLPWAPDIRPLISESQRLRRLAQNNRNDEQLYRSYLEQALANINEALRIDPLSSQANIERRQVVIAYSVFNQIVKLSAPDELRFSQAVDLLNSNQILEAEAIVRDLWYADSDNQLVRKLRELKEDIESATGRTI